MSWGDGGDPRTGGKRDEKGDELKSRNTCDRAEGVERLRAERNQQTQKGLHTGLILSTHPLLFNRNNVEVESQIAMQFTIGQAMWMCQDVSCGPPPQSIIYLIVTNLNCIANCPQYTKGSAISISRPRRNIP